jgi:hypothetical protein
MRPRADSDARRLRGLLLSLVLVASQASAWFHAAAISHVACLEHGEAMHGGAAAGSGDAERATPDDEAAHLGLRADLTTVAGHDHCGNAALLRWRDVALTAPAFLPAPAPASRPMPFASSRDVARAAVVYLFAPKTSPPPASV